MSRSVRFSAAVPLPMLTGHPPGLEIMSATTTKRPSRRAFLACTGAVAAGVALNPAPAAAAVGARSVPALLARRATYGPTPELMRDLQRLGVSAWLDAQLDPQTHVDDSVMDALAQRWPRLGWTVSYAHSLLPVGGWSVMLDLVDVHLARAVWSRRQLFEVMVDFWSNHLNVACPDGPAYFSRHRYDQDVIRANALGSFSDLLVAAAKHPAMMRYLNNEENGKDEPNENYGRELLELHTVGVAAGYSEAEVVDSARILTGLSADKKTGEYLYKPQVHYVGPVSVLGFADANASSDGESLAERYLRYLATHPLTATRLAQKLAVRFVSDNPPAALVDRLAQVYLDNDTAIRPVLLTLLTSREFAASAGQKMRTPFEDIVATMRVLAVQPPATGTQPVRDLGWVAHELGQRPLDWLQPDGYPDNADPWTNAGGLMARWNMHLSVVQGWWPHGFRHPAPTSYLRERRPLTCGALVDQLAARMYVTLTKSQRAAICRFVDHEPADPIGAHDAALHWRLPYLVALVLDAPGHGRR